MTRTLLALLLGGASTACALAAVGGVLYAGHPQLLWALQCFAGWGFAAGLVCGGLHLRAHGQPVHAPPALSAAELHGLVRAAEASAKAERQARGARTGTAADRRGAPAAVVPDVAPALAPAPAPAPARQPVLEEVDAVTTP